MPAIRSVLVVVLLSTLAGCAGLKQYVRKPTVGFQDMKLVSASLLESQVAFEFQIDNPNPVGLPVRGLNYQLDIDGRKFLAGTAHEGLEVPARGSGILRLPVRLEHQRIVSGVNTLVKRKRVAWTLNGEIDFGLVRVPLRASGHFTLPQLPRVSVTAISLKDVDLRGVTLRLQLAVDNPNNFTLPLKQFQYRALIGGKPILNGRTTAPLDLAAAGKRSLTLDNRVSFRDLGTAWQTLRNRSRVPLKLESQLHIPLPGGRQEIVPLDWSGVVPVR